MGTEEQRELSEAELDAKMLATRYGIRITTYTGMALGAIHFYGEAWRYDGGVVERQDLEYELDEPAAKRFNRHDGGVLVGGFRWLPGMKTNRFDSEEKVIAAGTTYLTDRYGSCVRTVERGDAGGLENPEITFEPI